MSSAAGEPKRVKCTPQEGEISREWELLQYKAAGEPKEAKYERAISGQSMVL